MTLRIGYASRMASIALLVLTICVPFASIFAQEDAPEGVTIAGSLYLDDLTNQLVDGYKTASSDSAEFTFNLGGNDSGFAELCGGTADMVVSTRPITDAEILNCQNAGVTFVETLLASEGIVFVSDPVLAGELTCTYAELLPSIVGAGAANPLNWQDVSPFANPGELKLYGPSDVNKFVALFEELLPEGQSRTDYEVYETPAEVLPILQAGNRDALAFMSIAEWDALTAEQKGALVGMEVALDSASDCIAATADNVVLGDYLFGRRLFLYSNSASLAKPAATGFLSFAFGADGVAKTSSELGFSVLSADNITRSLGNVTEVKVGRTFTRPNSPVEINTAEAATLTIGGSSLPSFATSTIYSAFQEGFTALTFNVNATGNDAGWAAFCNGEVGVIQVSRPANADELAVCEAKGIKSQSVLLGADAVVLAVSATNETLPTCLDYSQIRTLLVNATIDPTKGERPAEGEAVVTTPSTEPQGPTDWSAVGVEGNVPLLILAPAVGAFETDILFSAVAPGEVLIRRTDAPTVLVAPSGSLSDVDYRLGGLSNFVIEETPGGALTYVKWSQLQASAAKDSVRLLSVGVNCESAVAPTEETILSGEYPLSMVSYMVFSESALTDKATAALYWHLYKNTTLDSLEALKLIGFNRENFVNARDGVFSLIATAQAIQPVVPTEGTPEATEEPTAEVTEEVTPEVTEEATAEPTEEPTAEATEEPTVEATVEATQATTPQATASPAQ